MRRLMHGAVIVLSVAACGVAPTPATKPTPDPVVQIPTQSDGPTLACPVANLVGPLQPDKVWGVVLVDQAGERRQIVWPSGFSAARQTGGGVIVSDAGRALVAMTGDVVTIPGEPGPGGAWLVCGEIRRAALPPPETAAWPGRQWSFNGRSVPTTVISLFTGPEHCDMEEILLLHFDRQLGRPNAIAATLLEYVRDPENRWFQPTSGEFVTLGRFEPAVPRPSDAVFTGYRYEGMELWQSVATDAHVYLQRGDTWESWPRTRTLIGCV
jgi:hypothetical protein